MRKSRISWLWLAAAVSFLAGFFLVSNDSSAGWFFIILGIIYISSSIPAGERLTASHPRLVRWGLVGITLLLVLLAVVAGAVVFLM